MVCSPRIEIKSFLIPIDTKIPKSMAWSAELEFFLLWQDKNSFAEFANDI